MGGPKKKGCGTCRDRRILCDRGFPSCSQCTRAKRDCKGYGLRLSWPKDNDGGRRAIASKAPLNKFKVRKYHDGHAVMVCRSHWDIEMYMYLTSSTSQAPLLHTPVSWNPHGMGEVEWNLMSYFENETSRSLTAFGSDTKVLGKLLMRFSQSEKTLGSQAVLHALLGLASLARYGYNEQAMELKIASLRALGKGLESCHGALERVYHVAAGMLLCSIEVHQASCSASEWTWYIRGIKEVLFSDTADKNCVIDKSERDILLKWVYYHDVMKQFILRHWGKGPQHADDPSTHLPRLQPKPDNHNSPSIVFIHCRPSPELNSNQASTPPDEIATDAILGYHTSSVDHAPWTTLTITLMSEICTTIPTKPLLTTMSPAELSHFHNRIQILDYRIRTITLPSTCPPPSPYPYPVLLLYKLSMLIYLNRITSNILNQGEKVQSYIDEAFALLPQLESCKPHFPMYIVGWEARTEEQRATWLEMLDRTGRSADARSVFHVGALVRAGWAQDDLGVECSKEGGYWERVSALVGCCSTMPSFV